MARTERGLEQVKMMMIARDWCYCQDPSQKSFRLCDEECKTMQLTAMDHNHINYSCMLYIISCCFQLLQAHPGSLWLALSAKDASSQGTLSSQTSKTNKNRDWCASSIRPWFIIVLNELSTASTQSCRPEKQRNNFLTTLWWRIWWDFRSNI